MKLFSQKGFEATTVLNISSIANVPVGNIYRYYSNKQAILDEILPKDVITNLFNVIGKKVKDWKESNGTSELNLLNSEAFIDFMIENRLYLLIHFKKNKASKASDFNSILTDKMMEILTSVYPGSKKDYKIFWSIYSQLIGLIEITLEMHEKSDDLKHAFDTVNRYHMFGITRTIE